MWTTTYILYIYHKISTQRETRYLKFKILLYFDSYKSSRDWRWNENIVVCGFREEFGARYTIHLGFSIPSRFTHNWICTCHQLLSTFFKKLFEVVFCVLIWRIFHAKSQFLHLHFIGILQVNYEPWIRERWLSGKYFVKSCYFSKWKHVRPKSRWNLQFSNLEITIVTLHQQNLLIYGMHALYTLGRSHVCKELGCSHFDSNLKIIIISVIILIILSVFKFIFQCCFNHPFCQCNIVNDQIWNDFFMILYLKNAHSSIYMKKYLLVHNKTFCYVCFAEEC